MDPSYIIGIDLGGTKILTARCDLRGHVAAQARQPTGAEDGLQAVLGRIFQTVETVMADCDPAHLVGVGVGAPGPLDVNTGVLFEPPNLPGWTKVPVRDLLSGWLRERFGHSVRVEV